MNLNFLSTLFHIKVTHLEGLDEGPQQDADGVALP